MNPASIIFDCDGVILNSNKIKQNAYFKVASSHYGDKLAAELIAYLSINAGKTREYFLNYFIDKIVPKNFSGAGVQELLTEVTEEINSGLFKSEMSQSLLSLREKFSGSKWFIVSGGVESELRELFSKREISQLFDGGIFGGPRSKDEVLKTLIENNQLKFPALYIGDSKFDFEIAKNFGLDFIFVYGWTEFNDWENFCIKNKITYIRLLSNLL